MPCSPVYVLGKAVREPICNGEHTRRNGEAERPDGLDAAPGSSVVGNRAAVRRTEGADVPDPER
jgi:hypothetical protein